MGPQCWPGQADTAGMLDSRYGRNRPIARPLPATRSEAWQIVEHGIGASGRLTRADSARV
jgi:hypothetical protein